MSGSNQHSYQKFEEARLYYGDRWITYVDSGNEYLEITIQPFGKVITAVAIQGHHRRTTLYTLTYSEDGKNWLDYNIDGRKQVRIGYFSRVG
jgi:hypothetical protein